MDICHSCGKEIGTLATAYEFSNFHIPPMDMKKDDVLCSKCTSEHKKAVFQGNSNLWYLCPIFLGIIGGLLMFVALRKENESMASNGLLLSIILTAIGIATTVLSILRPELFMWL